MKICRLDILLSKRDVYSQSRVQVKSQDVFVNIKDEGGEQQVIIVFTCKAAMIQMLAINCRSLGSTF